MRITLAQKNLDEVFNELQQKSGMCWEDLAKKYFITSRALRGWRQNRSTIPEHFIKKIKEDYAISIPKGYGVINESETKSLSGRQGGLRRNELYGNPGTHASRSLGGKNSVLTHINKKSSFFVRKQVNTPQKSKDLAEFVGILLGDGGINMRQIFITLNYKNELEYAEYIKKLIKKLFSIDVRINKRNKTDAIVLLISRTALVEYLKTIELNQGNKVKKQIGIPKWINKNTDYKKFCLRGLFDTDGCFFVDRHHIKDAIYCNGGVNFVNRSLPILAFFKNTLEYFGFHPKQTTKFSIFLRKEKEVLRFFKEIGTSNSKHLKRFIEYYKNKYGRVPKWS